MDALFGTIIPFQLVINDEELAVVAAALGGVNVDNCDDPHNDTCV